jgi:hypothetical protein
MEKTNYLSTDEIVGKDFISLFDNIKFKISNELLNMTFKEFIEYELSMIKILNKVDSNKNGFIIDLSTKTIEHYDIN